MRAADTRGSRLAQGSRPPYRSLRFVEKGTAVVSDPILQWLFTVIFGLSALHLGARAVTDRGQPILVASHLWHLLMALVMVAMAWPWWWNLPWLAQLIAFTLGAAWFAILAAREAVGQHHRGGVWHQLLHVVMMLAMVWMVAVMPPSHAPGGGGHDMHGGHGMHGGHDMHGGHGADMPGMDMPGTDMGMSPLALGLGVVVTLAMLIGAVAVVVIWVRQRPQPTDDTPRRWAWNGAGPDALVMLAMLLGMSALNIMMF